MVTLESKFQTKLIKRLNDLFPGCYVRKHDMQQGWPDLLILWGPNYGFLEVKRERPTAEDFEPNQEWWIEEFNQHSFAACVFPENLEEVLIALQQAFRS